MIERITLVNPDEVAAYKADLFVQADWDRFVEGKTGGHSVRYLDARTMAFDLNEAFERDGVVIVEEHAGHVSDGWHQYFTAIVESI